MARAEVLIVGAGLAGLMCGRHLTECEVPILLLEATDGIGGRVRTDRVEGFRLDRGFQVYLTAYPEASQALDHAALDLKPFMPGALVRFRGKFHRLLDPSRHPIGALAGVFASVGTLSDKLRITQLRRRLLRQPPEQCFETPEQLTLDFLRGQGFSETIIEHFFRPWFGGVFLDPSLATSARMFQFVFRTFAAGDVAVPAEGMEAIAQQLAHRIPAESIRVRTRAVRVEPGRVVLESGETIEAKAVVVAADGVAAARLLDAPPPTAWKGVTCLYFAAERPPLGEPILVLNGEGTGPINNLVELTAAAPSYAPAGKSLLSVSVLGIPAADDAALESEVRAQLGEWFGSQIAEWRHLRTYRIPQALPDQTAPALIEPQRPVQLQPGLFICGDHRDNASIDGAICSGWRCAQAVVDELAR